MNYRELIRSVARRGSLSHRQAETLVAHVLDSIGDGLAAGEDVRIPGFGRFLTKHRMPRIWTRRDGRRFDFPETYTVHFRPYKALKERANEQLNHDDS